MSWSWPGFVTPASAWLAALFIPLVILYFLKLKRPLQQIPSLALWRQVMNDQRVNSPFQRFKRNLLLLLQCLVLACLVLAAMQPYLSTGVGRAHYLPILIDCSASMGALDQQGGISRLDAAKAEAREVISNLLADQMVSLIVVNSSGRRLTDFTNNKKLLLSALEQITVSDVPSRLEDGLRLTQALARTYPFERALFLTDGNTPGAVDLELPFQIAMQIVPPGGPNIGITELNARRGAERWEIFVRVEAAAAGGGAAAVEFYQDQELLGTEQISLEAGQAQRLVFRAPADKASYIDVRVIPKGFDSLASDNVAFLDLPALRPLRIFVDLELKAFRKALQPIKGVEVLPVPGSTKPDQVLGYDLVISPDADETVPTAPVTLHVGQIPPDIGKLVQIETGFVKVVDWQRNSPLLRHVQLTEVQMSDNPISKADVLDRDFESHGYEILAHATKGPLILHKNRDGKQSLWLLFHPDRSTLPYRVAFPILVSNLVQIALQQAGLLETQGQTTGALPARIAEPRTSYSIIGPTGMRQDLTSSDEGLLMGISAPYVGRYDIQKGLSTAAKTSACLLNASETGLKSVDTIQFREVSVKASDAKLSTEKPLWTEFAIVGLLALALEWWFFQRRPGGW
jgi:Ca-activated chloride channel family protein